MQRILQIALRAATCCSLAISCFAEETKSTGDMQDTNFPKDDEGRVYHVGLKQGEIANRILLVGDPNRAKLLVSAFDDPDNVFTYASNRGFITYTGTKHGIPVSIMSIGMGLPMIDFAIREVRAITEGPLSIIRLGSCGTPLSHIPIGSLVVADQSFCMTTNYDAYHQNKPSASVFDYFHFTSPIKPTASLHKMLVTFLSKKDDLFSTVEATDSTADFFYSTQGRIDDQFDDQNADLLDTILGVYPNIGSLQMETYHLFHLSKLSEYTATAKGPINVAACAIVLAQRKKNAYLTNERKHEIEWAAGNACLEALIHYEN